MNQDIPTPRTNEASSRIFDCRRSNLIKFGQMADFARDLERENARLRKKLKTVAELATHAYLQSWRESEYRSVLMSISDISRAALTLGQTNPATGNVEAKEGM